MAEKYEQSLIFSKFFENKEDMLMLKTAVDLVKTENCQNPVLFLRTSLIESGDACVGQSFSTARCHVAQHPNRTTKKYVFTGSSVFRCGIKVLEAYLESEYNLENQIGVPVDDNQRHALQKLLEFLSSSNSHPELTADKEESSKCCWTLLLAEHLFSKLSAGGDYIVDHKYALKASAIDKTHYGEKCFGDTSFGIGLWNTHRTGKGLNKSSMTNSAGTRDTDNGCSSIWHGSSDIIIGNSLPVSIFEDDDTSIDNNSDSVISDFSEEVNTTSFGPKDLMQLIAQTVVFSFMQNRRDVGLNSSLVPSVGISKDKLIIVLYDSENDVLLNTPKLKLFVKNPDGIGINSYTIVFLWLVLNYKLFCSGIVEEMKNDKANFFSVAGPCLHKYKNDVDMPCKNVSSENVDICAENSYSLVKEGTPTVDLVIDIIHIKRACQDEASEKPSSKRNKLEI